MKVPWLLCACALLLDFQLSLGQEVACPSTSELSTGGRMFPQFDVESVHEIAFAFSGNRAAIKTGDVTHRLLQILRFLNTSNTLRDWLGEETEDDILKGDHVSSVPITTAARVQRIFDERVHLENRWLSADFFLRSSEQMIKSLQDPQYNLTSDQEGASEYLGMFATIFAGVGDLLLRQKMGYEGRVLADFAQLTHLLQEYVRASWPERLASLKVENRAGCGRTPSLAVVNSQTGKYICGMSEECFNTYVDKELMEQRKYFDVLDAVIQVLNPDCGSGAQEGASREERTNTLDFVWTPKCSKTTPQADLCKCGQSSVSGTIPSRTKANQGEIPWRSYVSIHRMTSWGALTASCAGTILAPRWILTPAHCFGPRLANVRRVQVMAGDVHPSHAQRFDAESVILHKDYTPESRQNDVALIKLTQDLPFGQMISPACLPYNWKNVLELSGHVLASGWGRTQDDNRVYDILRKAESKLITNDHCKKHANRVNAKHICACIVGNDNCQRGSGGSIDYFAGDKYYTFGVDNRCYLGADNNTLVVYTRISEYIPWIEENTGVTNFCTN